MSTTPENSSEKALRQGTVVQGSTSGFRTEQPVGGVLVHIFTLDIMAGGFDLSALQSVMDVSVSTSMHDSFFVCSTVIGDSLALLLKSSRLQDDADRHRRPYVRCRGAAFVVCISSHVHCSRVYTSSSPPCRDVGWIDRAT